MVVTHHVSPLFVRKTEDFFLKRLNFDFKIFFFSFFIFLDLPSMNIVLTYLHSNLLFHGGQKERGNLVSMPRCYLTSSM